MKNTVTVKGGLYLSCLCLEHPKDSTCQVYLRDIGKWEEYTGICPKCNKGIGVSEKYPICLKCFLEIDT